MSAALIRNSSAIDQTADVRRRRRGAFYTPPALSGPLLERILARWNYIAALRLLDPACGGGAFLVEAARRLIGRHGARVRRQLPGLLHGVELDADAAGSTRRRLAELAGTPVEAWRRSILHADALTDHRRPPPPGRPRGLDWSTAFGRVLSDGGFDAVVGNPPFLNAIEERSRFGTELKAHLRERFACARGPVDAAVLFAELALRLVRRGGRVGLVLPNKILSAGYAAAWRRWASRVSTLEYLGDFSDEDHFDAPGAYPVQVLLRRGLTLDGSMLELRRRGGSWCRIRTPRPLPDNWGPLLAPELDRLLELQINPRLGAFYTARSGASVTEAYALRPGLREAVDEYTSGADGWPFVTSGSLIDPGGPARYLGRDYQRPRLARSAVSPRRAKLYDAPKVLVGGMTTRDGGLRVRFDPGGLATAVSVNCLTTRTDVAPPLPLRALANLLVGGFVGSIYRGLYGSLALSGGHLRVGAPQLRELPLPRRLPGGLIEKLTRHPLDEEDEKKLAEVY